MAPPCSTFPCLHQTCAVAVRALGFHESMDSIYFVAFGLASLSNVDEEQQADGATMWEIPPLSSDSV